MLIFTFAIIFLRHGLALANDIRWDNIGSQKITLFYPGVVSWEFLNSEDHSLGGKTIKKGKKNCTDCHMGKETGAYVRADAIIDGRLKMKKSQKPFEPEPISGKNAFLDLNIQAAYDDEYVYLRLQWPSQGLGWWTEDGLPDRVSIQLNHLSDKEEYLSRYGCFRTCHNDLNSMPNSPSKEQVRKNQYYGAIKRDDVRLYAFYTRTDGWAAMKADKELQGFLKDSGLIDLWKIEFKGKELSAEDGWILEDRRKDDKEDIKVDGNWENGKYVVSITRKLQTGDPRDIQLKEGDVIFTGIAIHDEKANHRKHYVSFPMSIGLGTEGDIKAERIK